MVIRWGQRDAVHALALLAAPGDSHRMRRRRIMLVSAALACLSCAGCRDAATLEIALVIAPSLTPGDAFSSLDVAFVRPEDGATVVQGRVAVSAEGATELGDLGTLEAGTLYEIRLSGAAAVCPAGIIGGRSLPFPWSRTSVSVPIAVGCSGAFSQTRGTPHTPRLLAGLASDPSTDQVIVAGGAERANLGVLFDAPVAALENYRRSDGRFETLVNLGTPRIGPAMISGSDGRFVIAGGQLEGGPNRCSDAVEVFTNASIASAEPLAIARCQPAVAQLASGRLIVAGGVRPPGTDGAAAEILSADGRRNEGVSQTVPPAPNQVTLHALAGPEDAALSIGGGRPGVTAAMRYERCPAGLCAQPVAFAPEPGEAFRSQASAYFACASGDAAAPAGIVLVAGGLSGPNDALVVHDAVWCFEDRPGATSASQIGRLPGPRYRHIALPLGPPNSALLAIGGSPTTDIGGAAYSDALLGSVDPCTCGQTLDFERIPLGSEGIYADAHSAASLADGTVLVLGARSRDVQPGLTQVPLAEALLFYPPFRAE